MPGRPVGAALALLLFAAIGVPSLGLSQRIADSPFAANQASAPAIEHVVTQNAGRKSPGTSALLSLLITGGGQVYNEEPVKGGVMFALGIAFTIIAIDGINEYGCDPDEYCTPWALPVGLVGALGVKIWSIVDASAGAHRWNEKHKVSGLQAHPTLTLSRLHNGRVGVTLLTAAF